MMTRDSLPAKTLGAVAVAAVLWAAWAAHGLTRATVVSVAPSPGEPTLAEVRRATERFQDVKTGDVIEAYTTEEVAPTQL